MVAYLRETNIWNEMYIHFFINASNKLKQTIAIEARVVYKLTMFQKANLW